MSDEDPLPLDMTLSLHDKVLNFAKKFPDNLIKYEYKYKFCIGLNDHFS